MKKLLSQNNTPNSKLYKVVNYIGNESEDKLYPRNIGYKTIQINNKNSSRSIINKIKNKKITSDYKYTQEINPFYTYELNNNNNQIRYNIQMTNDNLRKIIKEEFESLFRSYHIDINKKINTIKGEINDINLNNTEEFYNLNVYKTEVGTELNEIKNNLHDYEKFKEYNFNIISELEKKVNFQNKKYENQIININREIHGIKNKVKEISCGSTGSTKNESKNIMKSNDNIKLNEFKLEEIINKNQYLQKDFDNLKEEVNMLKKTVISSVNNKNKKLDELENKNNNNPIKIDQNKNNQIKVNNYLNEKKENQKKINKENNVLKRNNNTSIYNQKSNNNRVCPDVENIMQDAIKKLKLNELDVNKINQICENYEKFMQNFIQLSNNYSYINSAIVDLNKKIVNKNQNDNSKNNNEKENLIKINEEKLFKIEEKISEINQNFEETKKEVKLKISENEKRIEINEEKIKKLEEENAHHKAEENNKKIEMQFKEEKEGNELKFKRIEESIKRLEEENKNIQTEFEKYKNIKTSSKREIEDEKIKISREEENIIKEVDKVKKEEEKEEEKSYKEENYINENNYNAPVEVTQENNDIEDERVSQEYIIEDI